MVALCHICRDPVFVWSATTKAWYLTTGLAHTARMQAKADANMDAGIILQVLLTSARMPGVTAL